MIKIITLDLDDTLLNKDKIITSKNLIALKKAKELGIKIVIATGRPYRGTLEILNTLGIDKTDTYLFCFNGGVIYSLKDHKVIFKKTISGKLVKEIYHEALKYNSNFHAFRVNQELITPKLSHYTIYEAEINHIEPHVFDFNTIQDDEEFIKCMCVDKEEIIDNLISDMKAKYKEVCSVVRSAPWFLEFLNPASQKGEALKFLAKYLNIDIQDTIAFGDSDNDLSMIKEAGIGVAMENAKDDIKSHADFVTKSNNDDGIAYALDKFIFDKK